MQEKKEQLSIYIKENQTSFYRFAYSYTRNQDDALDVVQNAIVKGFDKIFMLQHVEYMKTWFYRILINESLNFIKKNKKYRWMELDPNAYEYKEEDKTSSFDLYQAVFELDKKYREIIVLYFFEEMTFKEIGQVLKMPISTVKSRFYKGIELLKKVLGEDVTYEKSKASV